MSHDSFYVFYDVIFLLWNVCSFVILGYDLYDVCCDFYIDIILLGSIFIGYKVIGLENLLVNIH